MPHRCMNCGEKYEDGADELIEGCECGSNLFLYKKNVEDRDQEELQEKKESVMEEIDDFIQDVKEKVATEEADQFDMESIKVEEDGVYEINLRKLLDEVPLIVEVKEGNYRLHLPSVFNNGEEKEIRLEDLDIDADIEERINTLRNEE